MGPIRAIVGIISIIPESTTKDLTALPMYLHWKSNLKRENGHYVAWPDLLFR